MKPNRSWLVFGIVPIFVFTGIAMSAAKKPSTVAEIALYKGADRQQVLEEGAKKEGKLTIYTSAFNIKFIARAFEKKYPYIKTDIWRGQSSKILSKVLEEYKARKNLSDVVGITQTGSVVMEEAGLLQPFYSPELASYEKDAIISAPGGGALSVGHYRNGRGIGYNTKLITKDQLPKTYQDLLDPKWKGKMAIAGSGSGVAWMGTLLETYGEDFVKRLAKQEMDVHMVSARALLDMIANGEYAFSPTCADSHVVMSQKKGAPVDWIPLEPVHCYLGQIMLPKHSTNPHTAMLFIDFDLTKESSETFSSRGYTSPRKDIPGEKTYKTYYGPFSTKQMQKWNKVFKELFIKK